MTQKNVVDVSTTLLADCSPKRRGLRHGTVTGYRDARIAAAAAAAHALFRLKEPVNLFIGKD